VLVLLLFAGLSLIAQALPGRAMVH